LSIGTIKEDYIRAIYILNQQLLAVRNVDLANYLGRTKSSVSAGIRDLQEKGYVEEETLIGIHLTRKGLATAKKLCRNYDLLQEILLYHGVSPEQARTDAFALSHGLSEESFRKLKGAFKGYRRNAGSVV